MLLVTTLAHYIFPKASNNHKAKLLQPSSMSLLSALLIIVQIFLRFTNVSYPAVLGYAANISPTEVIRLTNEKRQAAGLSAVTFNQQLTDAAREKGQHMLANGYWAHVAPDGTDPWYFFTKNNYKYRYAGENLARDFSSPSSAVDAWMASTSHRDNMLSSKYKEIGVAVVEGNLGGSDATIVVQLFGTQVSDSEQTASVAQAKTEATVAPTKAPAANVSPTIAITFTPTPTDVPVAIAQVPNSDSKIIANDEPVQDSSSSFQTLISPFQTTKGISIAVLAVLIVVTILDAVVIMTKRVHRVSGRVFAHLAFFGMIIAVILIIRAGKII